MFIIPDFTVYGVLSNNTYQNGKFNVCIRITMNKIYIYIKGYTI